MADVVARSVAHTEGYCASKLTSPFRATYFILRDLS